MLWRAPNRQFAGLGVCLRSSLLWGDVREMIIHHTDVREIIYSSRPVGTRPPLLFGIHRGEKGSSLRMRTFAFGKMEIFKGQTPLFRKSATTPGLFVRKKKFTQVNSYLLSSPHDAACAAIPRRVGRCSLC